jgi:murein DD-endopeptidase MepM/ murein hydrolase activator NlpD
MPVLFAVLFVFCFPVLGLAQAQPARILLDVNGISRIYPPFDTKGWVLTRGAGDATHQGDDYYAQDWSSGCFSQGRRLYAGISGKLFLNPDNDGISDGYGNTLVIADFDSGFALRIAHLQEFSPMLKDHSYVLAGQYLGKVGFSGNVLSSSYCSSIGGRGAHLHIALYKNIREGASRPFTSVYVQGGPSMYAADFSYVSFVPLVKTADDPSVYAIFNQRRYTLTAFSFLSQGWNFDLHKVKFDPVSIVSKDKLFSFPDARLLWPPRSDALFKADNNDTVFLMQDQRKKGLPYHVFACRKMSFGDVSLIPSWEAGSYRESNLPALGCKDEVSQSVNDLINYGRSDWRFGKFFLGSYGADPEWDYWWELRWLKFLVSRTETNVYHATYRSDPSLRYITFMDPQTNTSSGWIRVY